jgi:hypothetical protein
MTQKHKTTHSKSLKVTHAFAVWQTAQAVAKQHTMPAVRTQVYTAKTLWSPLQFDCCTLQAAVLLKTQRPLLLLLLLLLLLHHCKLQGSVGCILLHHLGPVRHRGPLQTSNLQKQQRHEFLR